jgi:hypothetical protein
LEGKENGCWRLDLPVFATALLILTVPLKSPFNIYDEGFALFNAVKAMGGEVPFRDFWSIYPPGQSYVLAVVFRLFGQSVLSGRIYDTFVRLAISILVYVLGKRLVDPGTAAVCAISVAICLGGAGFYGYAVFPSLGLGLLALLIIADYRVHPKRHLPVLAGVAVGAASVFRWDLGVYAGLSALATVGLWRLDNARQVGNRYPVDWGKIRAGLVLSIAGAAAISLPFYGFLALTSGPGQLWDQMIASPMGSYRSFRWLEYPPFIPSTPLPAGGFAAWVNFYVPLSIYGLALLSLVRHIRNQDGHRSPSLAALGGLTVFGSLQFMNALYRFDYIHAVSAMIVALLVAAILTHNTLAGLEGRHIRTLRSFAFSVGVVLCCAAPVARIAGLLVFLPPWDCYSTLARSSCVSIGEAQANAVTYVRGHTSDDEPIFVGNGRHDVVPYSDIGFYFLADRPTASYYHELVSGIATTLQAQERIVDDLASREIRWIVLLSVPDSEEPNYSAISSGVYRLDDYIESNFEPETSFGDYLIMRRKLTN